MSSSAKRCDVMGGGGGGGLNVTMTLGHTKLILCFTDYLGQKHDPVGRQKNKNKNDQTSHKFN